MYDDETTNDYYAQIEAQRLRDEAQEAEDLLPWLDDDCDE